MAKYNEIESNGINIIGVGTNIKGDISTNADIRIDGNLVGNLNSTGKVVIGESGIIYGEVICKNADISGKVEGKITASELLSLKVTAKIFGDINVNRLAVEPGCIFNGNCKMDAQSMTQNVEFRKIRKEEFEEPKSKAI